MLVPCVFSQCIFALIFFNDAGLLFAFHTTKPCKCFGKIHKEQAYKQRTTVKRKEKKLTNKSYKQVLEELGSSTTGLTEAEAKARLARDGENKLAEKKKKSIFRKFLEQFADAMIIILLVAAVISFAIAIYEKEPKEFIEPCLILLIVILNAVMGVVQENKAEKALEALKKLSAGHTRVIRDGVEKIIDSVVWYHQYKQYV